MKKRIQTLLSWLSGPKSDFPLFVLLLVLVNLVASHAFFRIDMTRSDSYSLSPASLTLVQSLEQPLSVQVFFTEKLPAPYNSVERYLRDLLQEYSGTGNRNFSYEFFDMEKDENRETAASYGLQMAQIKELKDNEVGYRNVWMSLVVIYSDRIEIIDDLEGTDGLEYRLTTTMAKMVSLTNSLSGLSSKIRMTLYASDELGAVGLSGFTTVEPAVKAAYASLNAKNLDMIEWRKVNPVEPSYVDELAAKYGVMKINWNAGSSGEEAGAGVLGIVLEYGDRFTTVPLDIARVFGSYVIAGLDNLEQRLADALRKLMENAVVIGYVTGHGELSLDDARAGAARLNNLVSDTYTLETVDLSSGSIPPHISMIMINGPKQPWSEAEQYALDQFLLRGGSVLLMLDSFMEIPDQSGQYGGMPQFYPVSTGLETLIEKYGISAGKNYVLDQKCYEAQQRGVGKVPLYYVPLVGRKGLNQNHPVSRDLGFLLFVQASSLEEASGAGESGRTVVPLASSSPDSWLMADNVTLDTRAMRIPPKEERASRHLAMLAEGSFTSAFREAPSGADTAEEGEDSVFSSSAHLEKSIQSGKLLVIGTSAITTPMVMDEAGKQPVAIFVRNAIDYLNGREELARMRTKGLSLDFLEEKTPKVRAAVRAVNLYGVPLVAVFAGLAMWQIRRRRRRAIQEFYRSEKGDNA